MPTCRLVDPIGALLWCATPYLAREFLIHFPNKDALPKMKSFLRYRAGWPLLNQSFVYWKTETGKTFRDKGWSRIKGKEKKGRKGEERKKKEWVWEWCSARGRDRKCPRKVFPEHCDLFLVWGIRASLIRKSDCVWVCVCVCVCVCVSWACINHSGDKQMKLMITETSSEISWICHVRDVSSNWNQHFRPSWAGVQEAFLLCLPLTLGRAPNIPFPYSNPLWASPSLLDGEFCIISSASFRQGKLLH
jgi:hypothetical protein